MIKLKKFLESFVSTNVTGSAVKNTNLPIKKKKVVKKYDKDKPEKQQFP